MYVLKSQILNQQNRIDVAHCEKIFSRLCRHFSPQCDSHGRSNQSTQSSATDSPGQPWFSIFEQNMLIWSDYQHQDQWFKQRGNSSMYQRRWLEIPLGNLMSENQIIHEYLIFLFIGHNDFPIASGFSASIQLLMWCLLLLKGDLTTPKVSHFFQNIAHL